MENNINTAPAKKVTFNTVDGIVIVIALLLISAFIFFLDPFDWFENGASVRETVISYYVEVKNLDSDIAGEIKKGTTVIDTIRGDSIGRVEDVKLNPSYEWRVNNQTGEMERVIIDNKVDVLLTISVECNYQEGIGYIVNGHNIRVGSYVTFITSGVECNGYCIKIRDINKED